jgi:PadR family transcriptional regulator AphA
MEEIRVDYEVREIDKQRYVECAAGLKCIENEGDALDLVAACIENDTNRLLLPEGILPPEFYELRTGLAGKILQKFVNYSIRVAAVVDPEMVNQGRFREMVVELNQGRHFRIFDNCTEASEWLASMGSQWIMAPR